MGCAVPTVSGSPGGDTSPCRAGSESPIGSCQEKPLQNILPTLLRAGGFRSAVAPLSAARRVSLSRQGCPWAGDGACAVASWCCHFPGDALGLRRQGQTLDLLSRASAQALDGFSAEQAVSAWLCHRARTTRAPLSPCAPQSMSHPRTCPSSTAKQKWPQSMNPVGTAELWTDEQVGFLCILSYFILFFPPCILCPWALRGGSEQLPEPVFPDQSHPCTKVPRAALPTTIRLLVTVDGFLSGHFHTYIFSVHGLFFVLMFQCSFFVRSVKCFGS